MFALTLKAAEPTKLDDEIDRLLARMKDIQPDTEEYSAVTDQLIKLYKLNEETTSKKRVSADTLAVIAGNLAGILLILNYEHAHVVTSKAVGFVAKLAK